MSKIPVEMKNTFRATRPRHLLSNDPRKLVSHYQVTRSDGTPWIIALAFVALAASAVAWLMLSVGG